MSLSYTDFQHNSLYEDRPIPRLQTFKSDSSTSSSSSTSTSTDTASTSSSPNSRQTSRNPYQALPELARCSRCKRSVSIDGTFKGGATAVSFAVNSYYCRHCAEMVGYRR